MKNWLLIIFCINKDLDAECDKIEEKIQKLSLNSTLPAAALYEKVINLTARKNDLINLRVLYNAMAEALTDGQLALVTEAASSKKLRGSLSKSGTANVASAANQNTASAAGESADFGGFRLKTEVRQRGSKTEIDKILSVCTSIAVKAGYSTKRFEKTYPYLIPQKKSA